MVCFGTKSESIYCKLYVHMVEKVTWETKPKSPARQLYHAALQSIVVGIALNGLKLVIIVHYNNGDKILLLTSD